MAISLRTAARSDVGLVRSSNQDSGYAGTRFAVVADGMGGHAGGDVASSVAVAELIALDSEAHGADAPQQLERAVARAQDALLRRVAAEPALAGMGTTVTALLRSGDRLVLAHLGDSRGYLLHDGVLTQATRDHTFVQRLVDEGRITPEEAEHHPQRNVILRVLGDVQSSPEPDLSVRTAVIGDRWLLCSDGLPRVVSDDTIASALREVADPGACADRLVQLALRAGAPDNVTCVIADVVEDVDGGAGHQVVGAAAADQPARSAAAGSPAARASALGRPSPTGSVPSGPLGAGAAGGGRGGRGATATLAPGAPPEGGVRAGTAQGLDVHAEEAEAEVGAEALPRRRRWVRPVVASAVVLVVLVGGALAAVAWLGRQYYVAADGGRVAVYQGLSQGVGPISLSHLVSRADVRVADLPPVYQQQVAETIPASGPADAERIVRDLDAEARTASSATAQRPGGSAGASPSPAASAPPGPTPPAPGPAAP